MSRAVVSLLSAVGLALAPWGWAAGGGLPDAHVGQIVVEGRGFAAGDDVPLEVEIRNQGQAPLPRTLVNLTADGAPYAEWTTPRELAPGESVTWKATYRGGRGMHLLVVTADPLNDIVESDQSNNSVFVNLGLEERGLQVTSASILAGLAAFLIGLAGGMWLRRPVREARAAGSQRRPRGFSRRQ